MIRSLRDRHGLLFALQAVVAGIIHINRIVFHPSFIHSTIVTLFHAIVFCHTIFFRSVSFRSIIYQSHPRFPLCRRLSPAPTSLSHSSLAGR